METPVERLYRHHARLYDATRRFILPARRRAIDRLGIRPGDTVLDFACGTGLNVPGLRRAGAGEIVGIDLSEAMLTRARRKYPDVRFLRGDLTRIELDCTAPRVICTWGLAFVPDVDAAVRNLHRHVGEGGRLVLLDFDRLEGPLRPARPLLTAWLLAFGARPPFLRCRALPELFGDVETERISCGYAALVVGRNPHRAGDSA